MQLISLNRAVEIWVRYGAYLNGVTHLAIQYKDSSFEDVLAAMDRAGTRGCWADEALRNAFNAGRKV